MLVFSILAVLMTLAALAFVAIPLWRRHALRPAIADSNVAILQTQRAELLREFAEGVISAAERDKALDELIERLSQDLHDEKAESAPAKSVRAWPLLLGFGVVVTSLAGGLYWAIGTPAALLPAAHMAAAAAEPDDKQILAMVEGLSEKLKSQPDDAKGWAMLGRSQSFLGRFELAAQAFERANALTPGDAQLLADYADAFAMTQQGSLEGKAWELVLQALKADPNNLKALAIAGTAELNRRNLPAALAHWEHLKGLLPPGSDDAKQVDGAIMEVRLGMGAVPEPKPVAPAAPQAAQSVTSVSGKVDISAALAKQVALSDTVFIFARAAVQGGPRMPLAVLRVQARELPRQFELTDAMAMAPTFKLSDFPEVLIEARISKSGNAQPQSGDLMGASKPVKPGARGVTVTIDRVVP